VSYIWTPPDPLNETAKTRSIYITELQDAYRNMIGFPLPMIDQSIGKPFRLDAIEELKTRINQLAIDRGYIGGVQHPSLLGRPYVDITKKYGKDVDNIESL